MKNQLLLIIALFFFIGKNNAQSNLFIDQSYSVEEMIMDFFNDTTIVVSNITHAGDNFSIAFFDGMDTNLGLDAGIAFCTGNIYEAIGPNYNEQTSGGTSAGMDSDIESMIGLQSNDAVTIEFDFMVTESGELDFNYVFASEEYLEFVNSSYNDAFGFFISGPGFNGPFINGAENISIVPDTDSIPVSINNVNYLFNTDYFVENPLGNQDIEYDGFTTPLPASFYAEAGETYHIKMVVADISDAIYDSAIFLSFNSLAQDSLLNPTANFDFTQDPNSYSVAFENDSKYAREWNWDFGNGETSTKRHPDPVIYAQPATYAVTLETTNYCCKDTLSKKIELEAIALPVSTVDLSEKYDFKIKTFPNPVKDNLQIRWQETVRVEQVQVFDMYGKSISMVYETLGNGLRVRFENKLTLGNYYVEIFLEDGRRAISRFVAY